MQQRTLFDVTVINNYGFIINTARFAGGERVEQVEQVFRV
jgi:hypothetical protein